MIKILLLFLFVLGSSWAKTTLELSTLLPEVKQGSITDCQISIKESEGKSTLAGLAGSEFGKTIYMISIEPFVLQNGTLVANARVVFEKVPASELVSEIIDGNEITITLKKIKVLSSKPAQSFLFGDFEVSGKVSLLKWIILTISVMILGLILFRWRNKYLIKNQIKHKKRRLKAQLLKPVSYDDIVEVWKNKHDYLNEFPDLDSAFKKLEQTLFKYQFKSQRNEIEITQVLIAFDHFRNDVGEVLNGI